MKPKHQYIIFLNKILKTLYGIRILRYTTINIFPVVKFVIFAYALCSIKWLTDDMNLGDSTILDKT